MAATTYPLARASTRRKWILWAVICLIFTSLIALWEIADTSASHHSLALVLTGTALPEALAELDLRVLLSYRALGLMIALWIFMGAALFFFDRSGHVRFEVTDNALKIKGDVWGKTFPLASLDLAGASIIDLAERKEYRPRWKLMGTSMPGYSSGYFSLRNGMKATVFLSDRSRVLCLPVTGGQRLLLSCVDPEGLLAALKNQPGPFIFKK